METALHALKRALKKSSTDSLDTYLMLLSVQIQNHPHATTEIPSSELIMNRHLRSDLDLLHPDLPAHVQQK